MTFPEAGIQILEKAGHPMHFQEIAQQAISEGLLSHVGQIPEQTMRERLVALARRSSDRKLVVVGPGQFALTDWGLAEDVTALAELEQAPEAPAEKALRSKERHPPLQKGMTARSEGGRDRDRDRKKKRRLPPLSVVAAEILGEVGASADLETLLAKGRERGQMSDELQRETLLSALNEENRKRTKNAGGPVFEIVESMVTLLSADAMHPMRSPGSAGASDEQPLRESAEVHASEGAASTTHLQLESRRQTARQLRRRIQDLSSDGLERLAMQLLVKSGYRDARPVHLGAAERERLFVARRRLGLTELRFLIQVVPMAKQVTRESVQALRSFMVEAEAHAGIVLGPGEATRDARTESQRLGLPLLSLLCAEAFTEELVLREVGVIAYQATVVDDLFWRNLRRGGETKRPPRGGERAPAPAPASEPAHNGEVAAESVPAPESPTVEAPALTESVPLQLVNPVETSANPAAPPEQLPPA